MNVPTISNYNMADELNRELTYGDRFEKYVASG
jgi:hypothetical protein